MPRSVLIVSADPAPFEDVRTVLSADARFTVTADLVHCDGSAAPLTNMYAIEASPAEWADWESQVEEAPDPGSSSLLVFETWSPSWVAEVGQLLANGLGAPAWFIDSADTLWTVGDVDAAQVALS